MYHFLPLDEWIIRERQLGNTGTGTIDEQRARAVASFQEKILDRNVKKKRIGDSWLVGVFKGVEERAGSETRRTQAFKRAKNINDTVDYDAAREVADESRSASAAWLEEEKRVAAAHVQTSTADAPDIPEGLARNPQVHAQHDSDFADEIKREVLMEMQRDAKLMAAEEADDFEAAQVAKLRKVKPGRPPKLRSQVMSDVSRMLRDRALKVGDAAKELGRMKALRGPPFTATSLGYPSRGTLVLDLFWSGGAD